MVLVQFELIMYNNVLLIYLISLWTEISHAVSLVRLPIGLNCSSLINYRHYIFFSVDLIRWLSVRLEMIANLIILFTAITSVFIRDHLTAGTVGLMITYALQITNSLNLLVRTSSEIETNIVSVERINEYAELNPEAPWEIPAKKPSSHWPTNGSIQYVNYRTCLLNFFDIHIFYVELKSYQRNIEKICS